VDCGKMLLSPIVLSGKLLMVCEQDMDSMETLLGELFVGFEEDLKGLASTEVLLLKDSMVIVSDSRLGIVELWSCSVGG